MAKENIKLANKSNIVADYVATAAYAVGDIVRYDGSLYKCKTAIATGGEAWDATHWESVDNVAGELVALSRKDDQIAGTIADDFDASATYAVDDVVRYTDGNLYKCKTAITTAAAWDATKWTALDNVQDIIPSADGATLAMSSGALLVKDNGVTYAKLEEPVEDTLDIMANFIEVKEDGFYVMDNDFNVGFAAENPVCYGVGLKNEE